MGKLDRKLVVESSVVNLLKKGIPLEVIENNPKFNEYLDSVFVRQLENSYFKREEEMFKRYETLGLDASEYRLSDSYSEVYYPVAGEEYPLDSEEQQKLFEKLVEYRKMLCSSQNSIIDELNQERRRLEVALSKYDDEMEAFRKIEVLVDKIDQKEKESGIVTAQEVQEEYLKLGLSLDKVRYYDQKYNAYKKLVDEHKSVVKQIEDINNNKKEEYPQNIKKIEIEIEKMESELIRKNSRLVQAFIRTKFPGLLVEQADLYSICYEGLLRAIRTFDPHYAVDGQTGYVKFSTYAYTVMFNHVRNDDNFVALTGYKWGDYWDKKKIEYLLENVSGLLERKATVDDLLEFGLIDLSERRVTALSNMSTEYTATELLDMVDGFKNSEENEKEHEYSEEEFYDIEKFGTAYTFDESEAYYNSLKEKFSEVLTTLTDRETRIVKLCYGLDGNDPMSAPQVGKLFGLSGERIRQILYRALRKLRHPNRANRIRAFYENDPENEEYTRLNY